jgi:hypothetical protein
MERFRVRVEGSTGLLGLEVRAADGVAGERRRPARASLSFAPVGDREVVPRGARLSVVPERAVRPAAGQNDDQPEEKGGGG